MKNLSMTYPLAIFLSVVVLSMTTLIIADDVKEVVLKEMHYKYGDTKNVMLDFKAELREKKCLVDFESGELFMYGTLTEITTCTFDVVKKKVELLVMPSKKEVRLM